MNSDDPKYKAFIDSLKERLYMFFAEKAIVEALSGETMELPDIAEAFSGETMESPDSENLNPDDPDPGMN